MIDSSCATALENNIAQILDQDYLQDMVDEFYHCYLTNPVDAIWLGCLRARRPCFSSDEWCCVESPRRRWRRWRRRA